MSYAYCDSVKHEYLTQGFAILRGLIPASLLADLRRETDKAREIARSKHGPDAQRLQPVYAHEELDHRPFRDFSSLPELVKTVREILGGDHAESNHMGVLLEPARRPWATNWHRDWVHHMSSIDPVEFESVMRNPGMLNQLNAALYNDQSLWVVPGTHDRGDTTEELEAVGSIPAPGPRLTDEMSNEEREIECGTYVRRMPGAQVVSLLAGDCAFYRSCQWHIGTYVTYTKRATLHDGYYGPEDLAWQKAVKEAASQSVSR